MDSLTRRALIRRGGALAAALGATSVGLGGIARAAGSPAGFTAARRSTYAAAVAAVGQVPQNLVRASDADWAADRFASMYDQEPADVQVSIDALLDTLESGPASGSFSRLSTSKQRSFLQGWAYEPPYASGSSPSAPPKLDTATRKAGVAEEHQQVALGIAALAGAPFYDHAGDRQVLVAL